MTAEQAACIAKVVVTALSEAGMEIVPAAEVSDSL
jgi:hypothetical protein